MPGQRKSITAYHGKERRNAASGRPGSSRKNRELRQYGAGKKAALIESEWRTPKGAGIPAADLKDRQAKVIF